MSLRRLPAGDGVDVVYDPVGGAYAEPALRSMGWQGRYLVVGFAAGEIPKLPLNLVLLKGCDVLGVFWGSWVGRDPAGHRANMTQLGRVVCRRQTLLPHPRGLPPGADGAGAA